MIVTGIITLLAKSQLFALSQWLPILNDLKSVWQYCPGFPANQFIFYTSMAYNQQRKFSAIRIGLLSVIFWTSLWFMKNLTQWWHFFFFFIFHSDALFSCLRVIWVVWTPQVPRLINFERFWSILFSSDIFRRRKFTTGKDFQCSQTRVPNSGPKTNNVQNSGRYQLLLLYCIDYSIVWWVPKSNMGFYLTIRKHYGEEFIFNCTKINWIFLHYYI